MKVIVCLDDRNGMLFNRRRQSRDSRLIADAAAQAAGRTLFLSPYSVPLFSSCQVAMRGCDDFLSEAGDGDVCFCEDASLCGAADRIGCLLIYRWNRRYPADRFLDISPEELGMTLTATDTLTGSSHETIVREVWTK